MSGISSWTGGSSNTQSEYIVGTNGAGLVNFAAQSVAPIATTDGSLSLCNYNGNLSWTKSFTCTLAAPITAARSLTLPDTSDTLVAAGFAATLTNKTIVGGANGNTVAANLIDTVATPASTPSALQILQATSSTTSAWVSTNSLKGIPAFLQVPIEDAVTSSSYTNVTTWSANGSLIFPGTAESGASILVKVIFAAGGDTNTFPLLGTNTTAGSMRIYDMTNSKVICEVTGMTGFTQTLYTSMSIANLSATPAIWQVQAVRTSATNTSNFRPTGCLLVFN